MAERLAVEYSDRNVFGLTAPFKKTGVIRLCCLVIHEYSVRDSRRFRAPCHVLVNSTLIVYAFE